MLEKQINKTVLADGTLLVTTPDEGQPHFAESRAREDAEAQAAIDALRASGIPRPVVFQLGNDHPRSRAEWKLLLPELRAHGKAVWSAIATCEDGYHHYVLRPDRARELLRSVLKVSDAARLFRTPAWPVSHWTVSLDSGQLLIFESRSFKDGAPTT
jgi:hypothetical protein